MASPCSQKVSPLRLQAGPLQGRGDVHSSVYHRQPAGFGPEPHSPIAHNTDPRMPVGTHLASKCDQQLSGGNSSAISLSTRLIALPLKLLSTHLWEGGGHYCRHLEQSLWQEWAPSSPILSSSGTAGTTESRQSSVPSFLLHSGVDVAFTQETQMPAISAGDAGATSCCPDTTVPFSPAVS